MKYEKLFIGFFPHEKNKQALKKFRKVIHDDRYPRGIGVKRQRTYKYNLKRNIHSGEVDVNRIVITNNHKTACYYLLSKAEVDLGIMCGVLYYHKDMLVVDIDDYMYHFFIGNDAEYIAEVINTLKKFLPSKKAK